jgi:hypothetical protein
MNKQFNNMNPNKQFWLIFIPYLMVVVLLTSIIGGCENRNDGDINKNYDGTEITVIDNRDYKIKVTVKFVDSINAVKYYCERLEKPSLNEWIKLINCKNFNGDLYIPYNQMKWFTFEDYNGKNE